VLGSPVTSTRLLQSPHLASGRQDWFFQTIGEHVVNQDQAVKNQSYAIGIREQIIRANSHLYPGTVELLAEMYRADALLGTQSDQLVTINKLPRILIEQGAMMNSLMRSHSVKRSLEIGFAYGFSTIWMLDALRPRRNALHVAVDPYELSLWHGIGLTQVKRLASGVRFEWIENFSIHALSDLIRKKEKFDFIFIDGNHRFDDVIVDFYLSNQLLRPGALAVFDDMWMNSVRSATNFIVNNLPYEVVPQPVENMLILRKTGYDMRDWRHFNTFEVLGSSDFSEPEPPTPKESGITRLQRVFSKSS
jgi:predicted O-methyltransferase YrrM